MIFSLLIQAIFSITLLYVTSTIIEYCSLQFIKTGQTSKDTLQEPFRHISLFGYITGLFFQLPHLKYIFLSEIIHLKKRQQVLLQIFPLIILTIFFLLTLIFYKYIGQYIWISFICSIFMHFQISLILFELLPIPGRRIFTALSILYFPNILPKFPFIKKYFGILLLMFCIVDILFKTNVVTHVQWFIESVITSLFFIT